MLSVYGESFTSEFAETGLEPEWTGSFVVRGVSGEASDSMVTRHLEMAGKESRHRSSKKADKLPSFFFF